ncbi:MAG: hypothetical protein HQM14_13805 [SAR324 cluster bacterium]|nr:hypothetical protein [SAR324 cluster bacterium]
MSIEPNQTLEHAVMEHPKVDIRHSIATRLLKFVFGVYFSFAVVVTVVHVVNEYLHTKGEVQEEVKKLAQAFEPGLGEALWKFNKSGVESTIFGMQKIDSISGVKIMNDQGEEVAAKGIIKDEDGTLKFVDGNENAQKTSAFFTGVFGYDFPIYHTDAENITSEVGYGTIYSREHVIIERVQYGVFLIIINAVIKTAALWLIFLFFVRVIVGRPLETLTRAAEQISLDRLDGIEIKVKSKGRSELKILEEAFQSMIQRLKAAKSQINEMTLNLENKVKERTQDLKQALEQLKEQHTQLKNTQDQLVHSEKMAAVGTLVAGVAHEINNPVHFILIGSQNIETHLNQLKEYIFEIADDEASEELKKIFNKRFDRLFQFSETIINGSRRIKAIVGDLRTFSRLEDAEKNRVFIVDGIESTIRLIQTEYKHYVDFQCDFQANPEMECWPTQLNQVFMNVMANGCQAIRSKQVQSGNHEKGIMLCRTFIEDNQLIIAIQDTGCGMSEEVRKKVFEPFFTTKSIGEGTGLGMSISYGIIEKHQGKIEVDSIIGQGSTFTIFLPLPSEMEKANASKPFPG